MCLKYFIKFLRNLQQSNEPSTSSLEVMVRDSIHTDPTARKICAAISLLIASILYLLQTLVVKIKDYPANKANLNSGEYLNFQYQICSQAPLMSEKFNKKANIQRHKFPLMTGEYIKGLMETSDYERINSIIEKQQIRCKEKEKLKTLLRRT